MDKEVTYIGIGISGQVGRAHGTAEDCVTAAQKIVKITKSTSYQLAISLSHNSTRRTGTK